ncbi:MAG: hypothetical protein WBD16_08385 [Pyrinomonadaceae bacterium]
MSFGFPASYTETVNLVGSRYSARQAVIETFENLGWNFDETDSDCFWVKIPMSGLSWGEILTVSLEPGVAKVHSKCNFPQLIDWGKNKRNVFEFVDRFSIKEITDAKLVDAKEHFLDEKGNSPIQRLLRDDVVTDYSK